VRLPFFLLLLCLLDHDADCFLLASTSRIATSVWDSQQQDADEEDVEEEDEDEEECVIPSWLRCSSTVQQLTACSSFFSLGPLPRPPPTPTPTKLALSMCLLVSKLLFFHANK
jgi:hypothetical protein